MGRAAARRAGRGRRALPWGAAGLALLLGLAWLVGFGLIVPAAQAAAPTPGAPRTLLAQGAGGASPAPAAPTVAEAETGAYDVAPDADVPDAEEPAASEAPTDVVSPRAAGAQPAANVDAVPTAAPAPTALPTPRPAASEPLDFPGAAVDVTLKLVAVLALAYLTLAVIKRYSLGGALGKRSGTLQVIESTTLAPNRSIYLVNVEGRRLLLGVTSSQITTLAAWDGEGVPQAVAPTTPIALDEVAPAK